MTELLQIYDKATEKFDDSFCHVCSLCGDLRMRASDNGDDEGQDIDHSSARLMQQELRYLRQNFQGLKSAVDKVLDDHEQRLRAMEFRVWLAIGGGAVIGWLGSVALRLVVK